MGYIYILTSPTGKSYIGQTFRPIQVRFGEHETGKSIGCRAIYNAIKKYGWENFEKDWYECPEEDLNFDEELLVREMGTLAPDGYNLKEGGGNGKFSEETIRKLSEARRGDKSHMFGIPKSEETRQKMSEAKKGEKHPMFGKTLSEETKQKLSEAHRGEKSYMFGKTLSEETKQKLSEATKGEKHHMYGKPHNEETKQKISEAQLGKIHCEDTRQKMSEAHRGEKNHRSKRVYQYDLDGTFIGSFGTSEEAVIYLNEKWAANINRCARGKCNSAYGYKWSRTKN